MTTVYVGYECLMVVTMHNTVIWDVTPFNLIAIYRSFGAAFRYRLQDCKIGYKNIAWMWRRYVSPKWLQFATRIHDVTSQKTAMHDVEIIRGSLSPIYIKKRFRHGVKHKYECLICISCTLCQEFHHILLLKRSHFSQRRFSIFTSPYILNLVWRCRIFDTEWTWPGKVTR